MSNPMRPGMYLIGFTHEGLFDGLDPDNLSAVHPQWQTAVRQYGPWVAPRNETAPKLLKSNVWFSHRHAGATRIMVCGRCSSTMDVLQYLMDAMPLAPWDSVLAVEQQRGRGQKRREWISPPGNIYASWYWPNLAAGDGVHPGWSAMASLLAGDLIANALEDYGISVRIKWPNDILLNDRKLCGILVEQRGRRLIVGIGLNISSAPEETDLPDPFAMRPISLEALGVDATPLALWGYIVESGIKRAQRLTQHATPEVFINMLKGRLAWIGHDVTIRKSPEEAFVARIEGLAPDGGLLIRRGGKPEVIYTGSILPTENFSRG